MRKAMRDMFPGTYVDEGPLPDEPEHHEAPSLDCTCGYYAMKDVAAIPQGEVYGRIALWGHIVEHDFGYRAQ